MNSHSSQRFSSYGYPQMWESFTKHDMTDSRDQVRRIVSRFSFISPAKELPQVPSLPACESPSALTLSSESCLFSPEGHLSSSDASLSTRPSHQKSRRTIAEAATSVGDRKARRRQQNRKSQRAFRDRKEAYQKYLEDQVDDLKQKHTKLLDSLASQCKTVSRLEATLGGLNSQIVSLQAGMSCTLSSASLSRPIDTKSAKYGFLNYLLGATSMHPGKMEHSKR